MKNIKIFIETFGCQMNSLDSELVKNRLIEDNYTFTSKSEDANIVLLNTCSVRDLSEQKIKSRLGSLRKRKEKNKDLVVGVLGCMAEQAHEELLKKKYSVDMIIGPSKLFNLSTTLSKILNERVEKRKTETCISGFKKRKKKEQDCSEESVDLFDESRIGTLRTSVFHGYVRVTRGCNKLCSFCVVPKSRGPEAHKSPYLILREINDLVRNGAKEVTLLGQTINHYNYKDLNGANTTFDELIEKISKEVSQLKRLKFLTSHPKNFSEKILQKIAKSHSICPCIHVPAQSGSNAILKKMNRGYTVDEYIDLIKKAKEYIKKPSILGDMIVGFPGETEEDFESSLSLIRKIEYKNIFIFKYSPRPGTVSGTKFTDNISNEIKKKRHQKMLQVQNEISLNHNIEKINEIEEVLVDGEIKGTLTSRTRGDHIVCFKGERRLVGEIVHVKIINATPISLRGEIV